MARFPFTTMASQPGSLMPRLSLELARGNRTVEVEALVDTGSAVSVLPYRIGLALGADWNEEQQLGSLAGGLASVKSRALSLSGRIPEIVGARDVPLLFAWAQSDSVPVLLGQTNFLMEFNVCFYRSENYFEVWRRTRT